MFYDRFKLLCRKNHVSCAKAAAAMGLSNSTPTKWKKTGAIPEGDTLTAAAAYFHVTLDYLLGLSTESQLDETSFRLDELNKKLEKASSDERYEIECEIERLQENLLDLQFIQNIEISKTQAQKNTRPTETGRAGSKYVKSIYEFVDRCGDDQLANLAQYVEFLKSQEKNKNT